MRRLKQQRAIAPFVLLLVAAVVAAGCGAKDEDLGPAEPESLMENSIPPSAIEPPPSDEADNELPGAESPNEVSAPEDEAEDDNLPYDLP